VHIGIKMAAGLCEYGGQPEAPKPGFGPLRQETNEEVIDERP